MYEYTNFRGASLRAKDLLVCWTGLEATQGYISVGIALQIMQIGYA